MPLEETFVEFRIRPFVKVLVDHFLATFEGGASVDLAWNNIVVWPMRDDDWRRMPHLQSSTLVEACRIPKSLVYAT